MIESPSRVITSNVNYLLAGGGDSQDVCSVYSIVSFAKSYDEQRR